jgi:GNAT superfamily N-acetyltransferase
MSQLQVAPMKPEDFQFAADLANTMHWNMTPEDFRFSHTLEPQGCLVLRDGETRVGVATCICYGRVGWFGNLIVQENQRGRGAGTLLVQHAIDYLQSKGASTVGLYAYPHLVDFYGKLGFKRNRDFVVLTAESIAAQNKNTNLRKAGERDFSAMVNLDGECFGASRQKLLKHLLQNPGNPCYVWEENSELQGFATAKRYVGGAEVGPLVFRGNDVAADLLGAVLGDLSGLGAWICLPASETALVEAAVAAGFEEAFGVVRMFLGSAVAGDCVYIAESLERG